MRRAHGPWRSAVGLFAISVFAVACGQTEDLSLCPQFRQLQKAGVAVKALDPEAMTAGEVSAEVEAYRGLVRQTQQVADGRYGAALSNLDEAAADVVRTLDSVQDDADYATWQPLVEDSLEDLRSSAQRVNTLIAPSCPPAP